MKKQIIVINGSGGVGKDTFVDYCRIYANILNISSVDKIKEAARILGWNGGKTESDRKFLSDLKLLSSEYNDYSYQYIKSHIDKFKMDKSLGTIFIHVREPEEIERIKQEFGAITLLIVNPNKQEIKTNMADANVMNYKYDYVIVNDGTLEDLENRAIEFIKHINN
jgi:guanylate kinase